MVGESMSGELLQEDLEGKFVDVHRHLECAHRPEEIETVAREHEIPFFAGKSSEEIREIVEGNPERTWDGFYERLVNVRNAYVSPEAIRDLTHLMFAGAATETAGFEMRFSLISATDALLRQIGVDRETPEFPGYAGQVMDAILEGRAMAQAAHPDVQMGIRFGFTRQPKTSMAQYLKNLDTVGDIAIAHADELVGLDILGSEKEFTWLDHHKVVIDRVREHVEDLVVHTELRGAPGVYDALALEPNVIGHGVYAAEDPAAMEALVESRTALELTPHNYEGGSMSRFIASHKEANDGEHPLVTLQKHGVQLMFGTDCPGMAANRISDDYAHGNAIGMDIVPIDRLSRQRLNYLMP
jgi:adenosine deaminase